jgi:hypothetical protein
MPHRPDRPRAAGRSPPSTSAGRYRAPPVGAPPRSSGLQASAGRLPAPSPRPESSRCPEQNRIPATGFEGGVHRTDTLVRQSRRRPRRDTRLVSPLKWQLLGPPRTEVLAPHVIKQTRLVGITIDPSTEAGIKSQELQLVEAGIIVARHLIRWEVVSTLEISPKHLLIQASGRQSRVVTLRSLDRVPFSVDTITSNLPGLRANAQLNGIINIHKIDITTVEEHYKPGLYHLKILTSLKRQPEIIVPIYVSSNDAGP